MLQTVTSPAAFSVTAGHAPDAALEQAVHSSKYATDSYITSCVLCHCWTCTRCCTTTSSPLIKVCYRQLHHQLCSLPLTAGHAPDAALQQAVHTSKYATDSYIISCVPYLSLLDMHQMLHYNKQSTHQSMLQTVTSSAVFPTSHCWTCTRCCTRTSSPLIKVCYRQLHHQLCSLPLTAGHAPDAALEQAVHTDLPTPKYFCQYSKQPASVFSDFWLDFFWAEGGGIQHRSIKTKKCHSSFTLQEQCKNLHFQW